jgi:hypothetical protein
MVFDGVIDALRVPNADISQLGKSAGFAKRRNDVSLAFVAGVEIARVNTKKRQRHLSRRVWPENLKLNRAFQQGKLLGIRQLVVPPFIQMEHKSGLQHDGQQVHAVDQN